MMAKVDWSINMFLDCERRNFVIQVHVYVVFLLLEEMKRVHLKLNYLLSTGLL
jgi:hypothetical protein